MRSVVGLLLLVMIGCATSEPIHNVTNAPIIASAAKMPSMSEVAKAIDRAGKSLGWQLSPEGPGVIAGRLALRTHLAVVEIEYDSQSYSIRYRDSTNLDAKDGQIHKAYNQWIDKLDKAIRLELQASK